MNTTCDVAIVGGGPAGLGAALELSKLGLRRVVVLERFGEAGGIPRHCGHPPFGMREFKRVLSGPAYARRLVQAAEDAGVEIRTDTTVTAIRPGGVLELATTAGAQTLTARRVLIATGNRERTRAQLLAPGVRPVGVMNTGALQSMVYLEGKRPFSRPVIVGSEIVALSALLTCRRHGIKPVAMVETRDRPQTRRIDMMLARLMGVPVLAGAEILAIEGDEQVATLGCATVDGNAGGFPIDFTDAANSLCYFVGRPEDDWSWRFAHHCLCSPASSWAVVVSLKGRISSPIFCPVS